MNEKVYFGGLPTEPDVKALRSAFPDHALVPGKVIAYGEASDVIRAPYGSARFQTVTSAWRRIVEKETNKIIDVIPGEAFVVLSESEKVDVGGKKLREAGMAARRSFVICARVDVLGLKEEERLRLSHLQDVQGKVIAAAQLRGKKRLPSA